MSSDKLIKEALELAGEAAASAFLRVFDGDLGATLYLMGDDGGAGMIRIGSAADKITPEQARVVLNGEHVATIKFISYAIPASLPDSTATHALYIEFGSLPAALAGLVLALPYRPARHDAALTPGMVQIVHCPDPLRYRIDELLPIFLSNVTAAHGGAQWLRALEYDRLQAPSQARFETSKPELDERCPSLLADRAGVGSNDIACRYLDAVIERYAFEDGLSYEKALYQLELDFSVASLARVNFLLGKLQASLTVSREAFVASRANLNFLYFIAIYTATVIAKSSKAHIDWYTRAQFQASFPEQAFVDKPETALIGVFNSHEEQGKQGFFPLAPVFERLFDQSDADKFVLALKDLGRRSQPPKPRPMEAGRSKMQGMIDALSAPQREALRAERPEWADTHRIDFWYQHHMALLDGGRVVWGCVVQANSGIYAAGEHDLPGDVLYDPQGVSIPLHLAPVADQLSSHKCGRPHDPRLGFIADYLTHERTCVFGLRVPYRVSSDDLRVSSTIFVRRHLPGGRLMSRHVPLLIHDAHPGIVMVLPRWFWSTRLAKQCAVYGWYQ